MKCFGQKLSLKGRKPCFLLIYFPDHPVGIGDHSTDDYWKNSRQALELLVDADDRLECLRKYFKEEHLESQNRQV